MSGTDLGRYLHTCNRPHGSQTEFTEWVSDRPAHPARSSRPPGHCPEGSWGGRTLLREGPEWSQEVSFLIWPPPPHEGPAPRPHPSPAHLPKARWTRPHSSRRAWFLREPRASSRVWPEERIDWQFSFSKVAFPLVKKKQKSIQLRKTATPKSHHVTARLPTPGFPDALGSQKVSGRKGATRK